MRGSARFLFSVTASSDDGRTVPLQATDEKMSAAPTRPPRPFLEWTPKVRGAVSLPESLARASSAWAR